MKSVDLPRVVVRVGSQFMWLSDFIAERLNRPALIEVTLATPINDRKEEQSAGLPIIPLLQRDGRHGG